MQKITLTLNVLKFPKDKIMERKYIDKKTQQEVVVKEIDVEAIELNQPELIKEGDTWTLYKTHFVVVKQTKEQKANKEKSITVGVGKSFVNKIDDVSKQEQIDLAKADDINPEDIKWS